MRIFHYRNVKMFFIPFLGAAVTGQNYSAPGWKKVMVALMGPLPGILVGGALGIIGLMVNRPLLIQIATIMLLLNGMNLLPLLPLDGGRVMQSLLFSRHYAMDIVFRAVAATALLGVFALTGQRIWMFLGIVMLVCIPVAWRLGRIAQDLKRQGFSPPPTFNDQNIPPLV